jgi:disulfide bond formation protein DsbB
MFNLKIDFFFKSIFIISCIAIISAYLIEYVFGHQPCNLCLIERIPYILSIILITIHYFYNKNEKLIIILLIIIFIFSSIISFYHFGIEQDFFKESVVCKLRDISDIMSKDEILKSLNERTISCRDVTFRIFGLSLNSINIFISLIITFILFKIYITHEKKKF